MIVQSLEQYDIETIIFVTRSVFRTVIPITVESLEQTIRLHFFFYYYPSATMKNIELENTYSIDRDINSATTYFLIAKSEKQVC